MHEQVFADRADAARFLGVSADASPAEIRRAFRLWAGVLHPDHGGTIEGFRALCCARDLLEPVGSPDVAGLRREQPPARSPWSDVLRRPTASRALVIALVAVAALVAVPAGFWAMTVGGLSTTPWGLAPAAVGAAGACVAVERLLLRRPDHGHVIVTRSVSWAAITAPQCLLAWALGIAAIEALPLMALPFVAVIALVNPGAGFRVVNVR